jgi:hypothetical protein
MDVGRRTYFQRDSTIADVVGESTEFVLAIYLTNVVGDANAVTEAFGVAELHRLPYRGEPKRLARVNGQMKVLALDEVKGA